MEAPEEKEERKNNKKKNDTAMVTKESVCAVCALFSALALLILFTRTSLFGEVGLQVHTLLTGLFGYMAYPLFVWFTYLSVMGFMGFSLVKNKKAAVSFTVAVFAIVLIVHTAVDLSSGALAKDSYLVDCFNAGEKFPALTIAGWVGALPVYGLSGLATPVGTLVILSVLALIAVYLTAAFAGKASLKGERRVREKKKKKEKEEETPVVEREVQMPTSFEPQMAATEVPPMPGYQSGYNPSGMGGYYPYTAQVSQRPGVMLSPEGRVMSASDAQGGAGYSPFGAIGMANSQEPQRPLTYEESKEILFGSTPAEIYKKNLIFDSNANVNKRSSPSPTQPAFTPTPVTYSSGYTRAVDRSVETPARNSYSADFESRRVEPTPEYVEPTREESFSSRNVVEPTRPSPFEESRDREFSPYELRTDDPFVSGRGETRGMETPRGTAFEEPTFEREDAYTLKTPEITPVAEPTLGESRGTELPKEEDTGYRRHDYMGLFSLSNPNVFGRGEEEKDETEETDEFISRDRSTLFDEPSTPLTTEIFSRRGELENDSLSSFDRAVETVKTEEPTAPQKPIEQPIEKSAEPPKAEEKAAPPPPKPRVYKPYVRIPLDYFDCTDVEPEANEIEVEHIKRMILGTLADYKVADATIASVTFGPTVTRYNVVIPRNVSPRKVVALEQEIAIALCSSGVNIYPSFEDGAVSVEVPNKKRQDVSLGCMLSDDAFTKAKPTSLTFAMGKDVANRKVYGDICKMTHLLVAGASGSGKSAFLASLIISLIVKYSPEELRLILIDPKKTEFVLYNGLPHLMINEIITDPSKAVQSLNWAIGEMNRRYGLFEKMSLSGTYVVNLDEYNSHVTKKEEKLPKIVIIVDELADLMLAAKKEMEDRIQNLTQKARAAGIHLVLATQRPSADVITGVIKGNLSTRIAFTVATDVDSRVILDQTGAQKLLGRGDMLYTMSGINTPVRVQGAFIPSSESQKVVAFIKANNEAFYDEAASAFINNTRSGGEGGGEDFGDNVDESYIAALKVVIQTGGASISMLQRKCSIGFNKAGKIIEWMEMMEYISPFEGSAKARKVLITKEEFERLYGEF